MKVKIIEEEYTHMLESKINDFLKNIDPERIVDIKYSGRGYSVPYGSSHCSAMIIIKDEVNINEISN